MIYPMIYRGWDKSTDIIGYIHFIGYIIGLLIVLSQWYTQWKSQREIPNPNHGTKRLIELVQGSNGATQGLLGELGITQGQLMLVLGLLAPMCPRTLQGKFTQKNGAEFEMPGKETSL